MKLNWNTDNTLKIEQLREIIRSREKQICGVVGCNNLAVDVHHLDGNHRNNLPSNLAPACKKCHNEEHNITPLISDLKLLTRQYYSAQNQRKANASRVRAYEALDIAVPYAEMALRDAEKFERHIERHIKALLKKQPFYLLWLKRVKGIGPLLSASVMAEIGSPTRFPNPSSLWHYAGLHVVNGEAPRRKKGIAANWNPSLKVAAWKIGCQFVRTRTCLGRRLYDKYKAYYQERDGKQPAWQPHERSKRRVAKDFLRCMWVAWMEMMNMPTPEPHPSTWPMPNDWVEG
jgi:hypothetical protein